MSNKEKAIMALCMVVFLCFLVVGVALATSKDPILQGIGFVVTLSAVGTFLIFTID